MVCDVRLQEDHVLRHRLARLEGRVAFDRRHVFHRDAVDQVNIAGEQRGHACGRVGDESQRHRVPGRLLPPIGVVALQGDSIGTAPGDQTVWPRADCDLTGIVVGRCGALAHQVGYDPDIGEKVRQQRRWAFRMHHKSMRVGDCDIGDGPDIGPEAGGAARHVRRPADGERDVFRCQRLAVLERHAGSQVKCPAMIVGCLPIRRETRHERAIHVHPNERFEDLQRQGEVTTVIVEMRIDGIRFAREPNAQVCRSCIRCDEDATENEGQDYCSPERRSHYGQCGPLTSARRQPTVKRPAGQRARRLYVRDKWPWPGQDFLLRCKSRCSGGC